MNNLPVDYVIAGDLYVVISLLYALLSFIF